MFELSRLVSAPGVFSAAAPQNFSDVVVTARDNLRRAMVERDAAALVATDAQAAIDRIQRLIEQADVAHDALETAELASAGFTQKWAETGARTDKPNIDPELKRQVAEAAAELHAATVAADGGKSALPVAQAQLEQAQFALSTAQSRVHQSVTRMLAATVEPAFASAERAAAEFEQASHEIQSLARAILGRWHPFSSDAASGDLLGRLRACAPSAVADSPSVLQGRDFEHLLPRAKEFVQAGDNLLRNPDAANP